MNYQIEQLLPLAAELADRYTSKESSSVTYETAGALMEAVLYCMKECGNEGNAVISPGHMPGAREIYRRGAGLVMEKARRARVLYDAIIRDFEDYGCMNYRDTIQKGMPEFFLHYDPVFAPGRHILSLDYPLLCGNPPLCGVDLIFGYLKGIWTEMQFLNRFHPDAVRRILSQISPEYKELYLDNLCSPVLLHVVGCVLSKQAPDDPVPVQPHPGRIRARFSRAGMDGITACVTSAIHEAAGYGTAGHMAADRPPSAYFEKAAPGYAARIKNGIDNNCLDTVFFMDMPSSGPEAP
ncbi:MAG: DUF6179 domain-containing protein [Clostridiales bacterium]|nr:DUF6179 domain-containing protein [Clostridiales bacterium]